MESSVHVIYGQDIRSDINRTFITLSNRYKQLSVVKLVLCGGAAEHSVSRWTFEASFIKR